MRILITSNAVGGGRFSLFRLPAPLSPNSLLGFLLQLAQRLLDHHASQPGIWAAAGATVTTRGETAAAAEVAGMAAPRLAAVDDPRPYNDRRYWLDDSKIRRELGWYV